MQLKYIAVIHHWFVHSEGFTVKELEATNETEAQVESIILKDAHNSEFRHADVKVIPMEYGYRLRRRLTWRERLTGWLNPD